MVNFRVQQTNGNIKEIRNIRAFLLELLIGFLSPKISSTTHPYAAELGSFMDIPHMNNLTKLFSSKTAFSK